MHIGGNMVPKVSQELPSLDKRALLCALSSSRILRRKGHADHVYRTSYLKTDLFRAADVVRLIYEDADSPDAADAELAAMVEPCVERTCDSDQARH